MGKGLLNWLFGQLFDEITLSLGQWSFQQSSRYKQIRKKSFSDSPSTAVLDEWEAVVMAMGIQFDGRRRFSFLRIYRMHNCGLLSTLSSPKGWLWVSRHIFFPSTMICFLYSFFLQWCIYTRPNKRWTPNSRAQFNSSKGLLWELRGCLSNHQNDR